jgi:hypothetical protein
MLIAVCILTPFAVSWKAPVNSMKTNIASNVSFSQNRINQVMHVFAIGK